MCRDRIGFRPGNSLKKERKFKLREQRLEWDRLGSPY